MALAKLHTVAAAAAAAYVVQEVVVAGLTRLQPQVMNLTSNDPLLDHPLSLVLAAGAAEQADLAVAAAG